MSIIQSISGKVIRGVSNGRTIGFPTINLPATDVQFPFGVYVAKVTTTYGVYKGALHYGPRKVLNLMEPSLEVHLLDFTGDLYDQKIDVDVVAKIRDTQHFSDLESLKKQIEADIQQVRDFPLPL